MTFADDSSLVKEFDIQVIANMPNELFFNRDSTNSTAGKLHLRPYKPLDSLQIVITYNKYDPLEDVIILSSIIEEEKRTFRIPVKVRKRDLLFEDKQGSPLSHINLSKEPSYEFRLKWVGKWSRPPLFLLAAKSYPWLKLSQIDSTETSIEYKIESITPSKPPWYLFPKAEKDTIVEPIVFTGGTFSGINKSSLSIGFCLVSYTNRPYLTVAILVGLFFLILFALGFAQRGKAHLPFTQMNWNLSNKQNPSYKELVELLAGLKSSIQLIENELGQLWTQHNQLAIELALIKRELSPPTLPPENLPAEFTSTALIISDELVEKVQPFADLLQQTIFPIKATVRSLKEGFSFPGKQKEVLGILWEKFIQKESLYLEDALDVISLANNQEIRQNSLLRSQLTTTAGFVAEDQLEVIYHTVMRYHLYELANLNLILLEEVQHLDRFAGGNSWNEMEQKSLRKHRLKLVQQLQKVLDIKVHYVPLFDAFKEDYKPIVHLNNPDQSKASIYQEVQLPIDHIKEILSFGTDRSEDDKTEVILS